MSDLNLSKGQPGGVCGEEAYASYPNLLSNWFGISDLVHILGLVCKCPLAFMCLDLNCFSLSLENEKERESAWVRKKGREM